MSYSGRRKNRSPTSCVAITKNSSSLREGILRRHGEAPARLLASHVTSSDLSSSVDDESRGVASINLNADRSSTRNAGKLVLVVLRRCTEGLGAPASIVRIVESLIWPFVAVRSMCKEWFSDKELGRMCQSFRVVATTLMLYSSADNREQTFVKYWLDRFYCQVVQDDQFPVREDWVLHPLFTGWTRRFVARRIAKRDTSFIYSLQKGSKQAWPSLGPVKESLALDKHKQRLTREFSFIPYDLGQKVSLLATRILHHVRRAPMSKFLPTGSACLQASRRHGGALSLFPHYEFNLDSREAKILGKLPVLVHSLDHWRQKVFNVANRRAIHDVMTPLGFSEPFLGFRFRSSTVEVVALPEPGKFRIISKGDGYLYSALQPLQGAMLSAWKHRPESTMLHSDLTRRVREIDRALPDCEFWCSVDYEAATDLIKKHTSMLILLALEGNPLFRLAYDSLVNTGLARYPDGSEIEFSEAQLMGHPLSFPMLCIANLAVYHCAIDRWVMDAFAHEGKEAYVYRSNLAILMKENVLVNGDDMLFKCPRSFYSFFLETAADCGFKMSQGKQYLSRDCCLINSQQFRRTSGKMKRYGYLNQRIMTGTSPKTGDSTATPTQIGKELNEMCRLCPWAASCIPRTFDRWKSDWFGPIYRPNWFLPVNLGGFGVDVRLAPPSWRVTRAQRVVAARFVHTPSMQLYRRPGMSIPSAKLSGSLANWRVVLGDYVPRSSENFDLVDEWLARLAFASRAHSGSIVVSDKVFIKAFKTHSRFQPMGWETLLNHWTSRLIATNLPPCPPMRFIQVRDTTF